MLNHSFVIYLTEPVQQKDEVFLLNCEETMVFVFGGMYQRFYHSFGKMQKKYIHVECGGAFGIGVNSQICLHLAMLPEIGILHAGNLGSHLAVIARRQHDFKSGKHDKQASLSLLRYHLLIHICLFI